MSDAPQDCNDIGCFIFGCFGDQEALSRENQAAVSAKNAVAKPEPQPKRAKPADDKTT